MKTILDTHITDDAIYTENDKKYLLLPALSIDNVKYSDNDIIYQMNVCATFIYNASNESFVIILIYKVSVDITYNLQTVDDIIDNTVMQNMFDEMANEATKIKRLFNGNINTFIEQFDTICNYTNVVIYKIIDNETIV